MSLKSKEDVDGVLAALGEELAAMGAAPVDLLVCGGSALQALCLVHRTTKDVDVLAVVSGELLITASPLPASLLGAAKKVARNLGLTDDWINPGPTSALGLGLPEGVMERAEVRDYGKALTIRFISRYDQIHFKLYAAVDQGGKHYQDLVALKPTAQELEQAACWSMTHDVSEGYRGEVKRLLIEMGQQGAAERI